MALATRGAFYGLRTGVDATQITRASKLVSRCTGMAVQPNKAVVGANAFAHESGIPQDGMLKHQETYEIMRPESVGAGRTRLVLGKHSGRHAFSARLRELGYVLEGAVLDEAFARFKALADRKKVIVDADLEVIVGSGIAGAAELYALDALQVGCGTMGMPTATVRLRGPKGELLTEAAIGTGPVDAVFGAIARISGAKAELIEYAVQSVTAGIDAIGEVTVHIRDARGDEPGGRVNPQTGREERTFHGVGADTDIIVASAKAYLSALNRMLAAGARASVDDEPEESRSVEASA
jgi:2-isopropylmalate synthase